MRILLTMNLPYVPAHGGANKSNRYLLEALARQQHSVHAVVPALATPSRLTHAQFREELASQGLQVTTAGGVDSFTLNGVEVQAVVEPTRLRAHLIEQIRAFAPDWVLVSSEDPSQNLLDGALQASPARVIYLAHTTSFLPFGPQAFFPSAARARRFAQAAAIMAISEYVAGYIRQWSGLTATFLPLCLYGAGPFPNFGRFDQGYVTMINPCAVKGIAIFLALARQMPQVPFAAVASWGTTSQDRAALAELPNVRLLEPHDEIDRIFAQTRVLLVPSLWDEAFGRVAVEAMLRGIPVLASDLGGLREASLGASLLLPVRPITQFDERLDENLLPELIVPEQDIGPWHAALARLLTDRAAYEQQATTGRAAAHQFVEGLNIAPFEDFLRRLAAGPAPGRAQTAGAPAERKEQDKAVEQNSLPEELASLTPEQRALLMLRLKKRAAAREQKDPPADPIKPAARDGDLPLSFAQQRLWFLDQLEPGSPFYNTFTVVRLTGPLDVAVLKRSLSEVVRRHEVLRTRFPAVGGHLRQVIEPARPLSLPVADLSGLPVAEREATAQRQAMAEARRPFDLAHGPLLRVGLLRLATREQILALTMHHIISDGWSAAIFIQEVAALYEAFSAGRPSPLPELPIQYADFAVWQREWLQGSTPLPPPAGGGTEGGAETSRQGDKETRSQESGVRSQETRSPSPIPHPPSPMELQLTYWRQQLADLPELALPTDEPRPPVQRFLGAMHTRVLPPALTAAINALSQREDVTLFMTLLGAFQALLARYSGQNDIVVGSPIANRNRSQIQGLIGFFVNMLVMRSDLTGNPTFRELLARVREVALGAYAHQDLPFEQLVEELHPQRDLGRNPLFQVAFVLQNVPQPALSPGELTMSPVAIESTTAKFDLTLNVVADAHELILMMEYSTDLYEAATIARMMEHFQILLDGVVAAPWRRLSDLPLLSDAERRQLLVEWNDTWAEYPLDSCMHHLFEAQAQRTPDAVAVVFDRPRSGVRGQGSGVREIRRQGDKETEDRRSRMEDGGSTIFHPPSSILHPQSLTYHELNRRANQVAHYLRAQGVGPEILVAICMERSPEILIGMLGILKAGGAYIPLDPAHPAERLAFMLDDARPAVLLTQQTIYDLRFTIYDLEESRSAIQNPKSKIQNPVVVCIDTHAALIARRSEQNPDSGVGPDNLAYVIYTSGSTGAPKGVLVAHRGLCSMATSEARILHVDAESRVLQLASFSFDASMWDLLMALPIGAALCMASEESRLPGPELARLLDQHAITIATMTPSMLATLSAQRYPALHTIIAIGEACPAEIVARWAPGRRFINGYGPTEATIGATLGECADASRRPSIGRPLLNTQIYLLDPAWQPVPIGVAGEIYIGGVGVARGYLNRPDLTAERFVPNPFAIDKETRRQGLSRVATREDKETGDATRSIQNSKLKTQNLRLYRTGDLARYRPNGEIEFLGRSDHQVKVRGFRIELGEIEAALAQHPDVREAVVMVREDAPGGAGLVAYLVPKIEDRRLKIEDSNLGSSERLSSIFYPLSSELRVFLKEQLPDYMIPAAFVLLDALPLTHSGKVDRRALPAPDGQRPALAAPFMPPRTPLEANIAEVWRAVLQLDQVGIHDNFFDLGGHSLRLVEVQSGLRALLSREIAIIDLFKYPTIGGLAAFLRQEGAAEPQPDRPAPVPSSAAIAIIAVSGRFPDAPSVEAFWHNLCDGVESVRFFSDEQLRAVGVDPATLQDPHYVKARAVLERIEWFDAAFFGYTPREAELIDPQQRLFLECAWEALERAGYAPLHTPGRVGVFAGTSMNSYVFNLYTNPDVITSVGNFQAAIGNDKDFLPTRVSYKLNLKGPSIAVQTACSTSLVAVHLACQSLREGECDMALAGGVSIIVPQVSGHLYSEGGIGSADGHCRAFDAQASGMIGGSGAGVVVLKRLDEALVDGDAILALIRGSAINNDGADKVGYTAPSVAGQAAVISAAQALAGVDPATIGYVEAHGTATPLGDPIEVAALTTAFRRHTAQTGFCALGSVKTNIGHLDAAAGVAGLIKAVLALQHQRIPPSLHFEQPNPNIDFVSSPFYVNTALSEWQADGAPRRAGVSSFGIGGTNAHLVLEEAPPLPSRAPAPPWQLLLMSAKSPAALDQASADLAAALQAQPDLDLADVAFTIQVGRSPFAHRRFLVARDLPDAATALASRDPSRLTSALAPDLPPPLVFLFPGQGTQYSNMGRELYESEPVFRAVVDQCSELLAPQLGLDLRDLLYPDLKIEDRRWKIEDSVSSILDPLSSILELDQTEYTQPALFVIEYALAKLWMHWGVRPQAMIGHSIGEYVAACLAGVFSLEDALALVAARGHLIQNLPQGAMLSVALNAEALRPLLGPELDLAAINAPSLCVVSGPSEAVERLERQLNAQGVESRRLHTSHAFHSAMLDPVRETFRARVAQVRLSAPQLPYLSNVSGSWITAQEATDPAYWAAQLRQEVRFADGIAELLREEARVLLEVGPGHTLGALARQQAGRERLVLATLPAAQELQPARAVLLRTLGTLWLAGVEVDWTAVHAHEQRRRVLLPTYPFERRRYWVEAQPQEPQRAALHKKAGIADWFYVPSWKRMPPLKPFKPQSAAEQPARWLVFADSCGIGAQVLKRLEAAGQDLIEVRAGAHFDQLGERVYTLDPGRRADYDALLGELRAAGQTPRTIVHLWSVTPEDAERPPAESFDTCQNLGLYSLLFLAQALEKQRVTDPLDLVVVSNNLQAVSGEETLRPEKATVLAPCKVIPQEYPNLRCRSIDVVLPDAASGATPLIDQLLAEIAAPAGDPVVAYRGPHRWVQGVEAMPLDDDGAGRAQLREHGVYLITGGLGNIGLALAGELARAVQARLVLLGRAALPARAEWDGWLAAHSEDDDVSRKIRGVYALEAHGAEVELLSADVADEAQMRAAIARAVERFGALHGVIHAAGIVGEQASRTIQETDRDTCAIHFQPKVRGLYILEKVLRGRTLDFCLLQSSLSAVLGGLGFAAYAATNVFMDAFAQRQRSPAGAIPWMSVNWDGWDFQPAAPASLAMLPSEGVEAFTRLLALETLPQVMVAASDLQTRLDQWVRLGGAASAAPGEAIAQHPRPSLQDDYVAPRDSIEQTIAGIWQTSLGIEQVGVHDSFFELGGHSLLGTRVISRIREAFQVELPLRALFETPTVAGLALAVAQQQGSHLSKIDRVDRGDAEQLLATLDQLSEEHVDSLLDAMLTKEGMKR